MVAPDAGSGGDMSGIGLLTPGPHNETYFEHAYLARYLGLLLLEGGDLVLTSAAPLGAKEGTPAFLGRRQQHHVATMRTNVTFSPQQDGDRAGLAALQSDDAWLFFGLSRLNGQDRVALYTRAKGEERLVASAPVDNRGPMTLTIRAEGGKMTFDYAGAGGMGTLASDLDARFLSTQDAGGFTGTIVGPYVWTRSGG